MKLSTIRLVTTGAFAVAGFGVAYFVSKRVIRKRCKKQVFTGCMKVPLLPEGFCNEQSEKICDLG